MHENFPVTLFLLNILIIYEKDLLLETYCVIRQNVKSSYIKTAHSFSDDDSTYTARNGKRKRGCFPIQLQPFFKGAHNNSQNTRLLDDRKIQNRCLFYSKRWHFSYTFYFTISTAHISTTHRIRYMEVYAQCSRA